ncbi:MAG: phytanoyl-CoA dioxygenase family protein [Rhodospirillales bacterium]|nr:phytanoyl-CoA dioxygenase family protein [Rhodospirillales bacterium]
MTALTSAEISAFRRDGAIVRKHQLFSAPRMAALEGIFDEHVAKRGDRRLDELDAPHFEDARLLDYLLDATVLDVVEPLIGPDVGVWASAFVGKEPLTGRATPWHEDSAYWQAHFDAHDRIVTVWLALDPATRSNGCMRVIPGTQANGFSEYRPAANEHRVFPIEIAAVDEQAAVDLEMARGEYSLHDARIVHGSWPNPSPDRRAAYTMRYFSTALKIAPATNESHRVWLGRGRNLAGNQYENA